MASERGRTFHHSEIGERPIDIGELEARGAVRVGLIRQLLVSLFAAAVALGAVWVLNVMHWA